MGEKPLGSSLLGDVMCLNKNCNLDGLTYEKEAAISGMTAVRLHYLAFMQ